MDAVCYGFRCLGQLSENKFDSVLKQLDILQSGVTVKFVTFTWSKCYIILDDNSVIIRGLVDSCMKNRKQVVLPFPDALKKVACLKRYDLFLTETGSCWKFSENGDWTDITHQFKIMNDDFETANFKIVDIVSNGDEVHLELLNTGTVFSFPVQIDIPGSYKVKKVSCGLEHNICLLESGSVYVWGSGSRGQLGNGSLNVAENPELLVFLDGLIVVDVDAGGWHSAALTNCGDLYTWGWNNFGQLGFTCDKSNSDEISDCDSYVSVLSEPKLVDWPNNMEVQVKRIACGSLNTMALLDDGAVWGCGSNKYGQLNPLSDEECYDEMTRVPVPENVSTIHNISCVSWNSILYVTCKDGS